jgi:hypothetical protein
LLNGLIPGPTHLLPDIGLFLLTNREYGSGESVSDDQIIFEDFTESAQWCYDNRYFFDGGYVGQNNPIEWLSDKAPFCLLDVWEIGSKFSLTPVFPHSPTDFTDWNVSAKISNVFNFMQMRNFAFASIDEQTNRTIQVSIKWREERQGESISSPGIFPVEREILVREAAPYGSESDPIVRVDQTSDWITNEKQAIDYAKYLIRKARLESQTATIELTQDSLLNPLKPGSYIGIPFEMTYFDEFSSGIVREDGTLVATSDMQPGVYQASIWNGQLESPVESSTITVLEDGTASPTGIIFIVESQQSDFRTYKVMDVTPGEKAGFTLQVVEAPTDSSGRLLMSQNWGSTVSDAYWVILK